MAHVATHVKRGEVDTLMEQLKPISSALAAISISLWIIAIIASFAPVVVGAAATSTVLALGVGAMAWL